MIRENEGAYLYLKKKTYVEYSIGQLMKMSFKNIDNKDVTMHENVFRMKVNDKQYNGYITSACGPNMDYNKIKISGLEVTSRSNENFQEALKSIAEYLLDKQENEN